MPLTPKQKAFADYYIETGNATEAARKAGYKGSSNTLGVTGSENLRKPIVSAYIKSRMAEIDAGRIATADEVMKFYTSVMRGEVKDQFGLDAQLADRLNAGKELMKRFAAVDDRQKDALDRLDALFEEFRNAVDAETT
jgi:phage terminase small subunit